MSISFATNRVFRSSELSRNSGAVFAAAEKGPIEVTRRDASSLVLMSKQESDARVRLLEIAADLIAVATDERGTLAERMAERFPWMLALSETSREECARELLHSARASFSTGQVQLAIISLNAWKETALALAEGLSAAPGDWEDAGTLVVRP